MYVLTFLITYQPIFNFSMSKSIDIDIFVNYNWVNTWWQCYFLMPSNVTPCPVEGDGCWVVLSEVQDKLI